jgi:hypothetical protein
MVSHLCAHIISNVRVDSNHNPALTSAITTIDLDFGTAIRILSPPYLSDSLHLGRFTIIRTFHRLDRNRFHTSLYLKLRISRWHLPVGTSVD